MTKKTTRSMTKKVTKRQAPAKQAPAKKTDSPPQAALKRAVSRAIAEGSPVFTEKPPKKKAAAVEWTERGKNEWFSSDGSRIKMLTNHYLNAGRPGKGYAPESFYVYHERDYLGFNYSLEEAKERARKRERSPRAYDDVTPGGTPAFLKLTQEERRAARAEYDASRKKAAPRQETDEERKAREIRASIRADRRPRGGGRAGVGGDASKDVELSDDARIIIRVSKNPKKPGSSGHARFETLMKYDGKTVASYLGSGGNVSILVSSIKRGRAALEK